MRLTWQETLDTVPKHACGVWNLCCVWSLPQRLSVKELQSPVWCYRKTVKTHMQCGLEGHWGLPLGGNLLHFEQQHSLGASAIVWNLSPAPEQCSQLIPDQSLPHGGRTFPLFKVNFLRHVMLCNRSSRSLPTPRLLASFT